MSFTIHKHDYPGCKPWEYLPAAAGTYHVGDALYTNGGKVAHLDEEGYHPGIVRYIAMADCQAESGKVIPVVRVTSNEIYKTVLNDGESVSVGAKCSVYRDRITTNEEGHFEVVQVDGNVVYGRFFEGENYV